MMLSHLRASGWRAVMTRELPTMVFALVVAELWFKFGSFSLEALAFLAVWYAASAAVDGVVELARGIRGERPHRETPGS
jgi:hypothetical protein